MLYYINTNKTYITGKGGNEMNNQNRADIRIGAQVKIVLKADQRTGRLTVAKILTNSAYHPHGIKVMLLDGQVGRVQEIIN